MLLSGHCCSLGQAQLAASLYVNAAWLRLIRSCLLTDSQAQLFPVMTETTLPVLEYHFNMRVHMQSCPLTQFNITVEQHL